MAERDEMPPLPTNLDDWHATLRLYRNPRFLRDKADEIERRRSGDASSGGGLMFEKTEAVRCLVGHFYAEGRARDLVAQLVALGQPAERFVVERDQFEEWRVYTVQHRPAWPEACQTMTDLTGWYEVDCALRERFYADFGVALKPYSSLTDPDGQHGRGVVYTEWGAKYDDRPWLRDYRWTDEGCRHYMPAAIALGATDER